MIKEYERIKEKKLLFKNFSRVFLKKYNVFLRIFKNVSIEHLGTFKYF